LESKTCRGFVFNKVSTEASRCDDISSVTHTELIRYFNEFVIQLKVSESILLNFIEKEIQAKYRSKAEEEIQQIIDLLDEEILPTLALTVSLYTVAIAMYDWQA